MVDKGLRRVSPSASLLSVCWLYSYWYWLPLGWPLLTVVKRSRSLFTQFAERHTDWTRGTARVRLGNLTALHWLRVGHMPISQPIAVGRGIQRAHWLRPGSQHPTLELLGVGSVWLKPHGRVERFLGGKPAGRATERWRVTEQQPKPAVSGTSLTHPRIYFGASLWMFKNFLKS